MTDRARLAAKTASRHPLVTGGIALFVLLIAVYVWSIDMRASWGASITGDEPFYLITTQSLIQDFDLDTRNQLDRGQYASFFDHADGLWVQSVPTDGGRLLSPHNPGLSVLLIPGFALGGLLGAQMQMVLLAALAFALAYVLAARVTGAHRVAWVATLAVALSATAFVYASEIYPEVPAALVLVVALLLVAGGIRGAWTTLALVALLSLLPWLGVKYAPLAVLVAAYAFWQGTSATRWTIVGAGVLSAVSYGWFHLAVYGHLTPYSLNLVYAQSSNAQLLDAHVSVLDRSYRLWGLLVDERFGVGRWAPVLIASAAALPLLWRAGARGRLVLSLVLTQVLIATFVAITMMGWWFPGRTLMAVLPLMALPLAMLGVHAGVRLRAVLAALFGLSVTTTAALAIAGHAREVAIAVNPFELSNPIFVIVGLLFPSYVSWDAETWLLTVVWVVFLLMALLLVMGLPAHAWSRWRPRWGAIHSANCDVVDGVEGAV